MTNGNNNSTNMSTSDDKASSCNRLAPSAPMSPCPRMPMLPSCLSLNFGDEDKRQVGSSSTTASKQDHLLAVLDSVISLIDQDTSIFTNSSNGSHANQGRGRPTYDKKKTAYHPKQ